MRRRRSRYAKENDALNGRHSQAEGKLTTILVERDKHPLLLSGLRKNFDVAPARLMFASPNHIIANVSQGFHCIAGNVLVREYPHTATSRRERIDFLIFQSCAGIPEACLDIFMREARIVSQYLGVRPTLREEIDDKLY